MKKILIMALMTLTCVVFAQKKNNGTIYVEHPAIKVVEDMTKAFVAGDAAKVASYLADDFKAYNGLSTNRDDKGQDKAAFLKSMDFWKNEILT